MNANRIQRVLRRALAGSQAAARQVFVLMRETWPALQASGKCGHMNEDGTFKGGFDGCVLHMTSACGGGHSEESAKRICGKIAQMKASRVSVERGSVVLRAGNNPDGDDDSGEVCPHCGHKRCAQCEEVLAEGHKPENPEDSPDDLVTCSECGKSAKEGEWEKPDNSKSQIANRKLEAQKAAAADGPAALSAAAVAADFGDGVMMYVPGGVHEISCGCAGKATAQVVIAVDETTAAVLQASLHKVNAEAAPQRALFDFEHQGKEAMAWPLGFEWRNQPRPGVFARAEYSKLGKDYVDGKVVRGFSGSFITDADLPKRTEIKAGKVYRVADGKRGSAANPARIIGLDFPYAGTLTNNPAFQENLPLWAKAAGAAAKAVAGQADGGNEAQPANEAGQENTKTKMKADEKARLQTRVAELEQEIPVLKATKEANPEAESVIAAKETELQAAKSQLEVADLHEKNTALEAALTAQRTKDAKGAVQAAVKRGAIPIKNLELQAKWEQKLIEDPANAVLLAAMPGSAAVAASERIILGRQVQMVRESSLSVLNAFSAERDPKARAALYATEIVKRLKDGDPLPLQAANNPGTLVGTLVSQRTLELLKLTFPILSSITTDFSDQNGKKGQTIDSRIITVPAAQDYDPVNGWPDSDAVATDVPVTLSAQKGVSITFTSDVLSGTVRRLFDEFGPAQAYALAKAMVDALYNLFTVGNYADNVAIQTSKIDFGRPTLIDMGVALDAQGVPDGPMNRFCLLSGPYFGALKKDQAIITLAAYQDKGIIEQGVLPDVEGFRVIKAINLNPGGGVVGFAGSRSSGVIAARIDSDYTTILPGASYGNVTTVMDPDIGLSVLQVQFVNHQKASATQRISLIFGVAKGQTKAGQTLTGN